ncbi:MAG: lactate racemase domain-containing protein [Candidatus Sumerlaeia bacterium]|nr:lactate racemase domain-containing protein [Candidatus Sumerlaeia bacterium]
MNIKLSYGTDTLPVDVPDNWINGRLYRPKGLEPCADVRGELMAALESMTGVPSIEKMAEGKQHCVIAVDPFEPVVTREVLPEFIEVLEDHTELSASDITILLANRLWKPLLPAQVPEVLDASTLEHYRVVLHSPFDADSVEVLTDSSRNVPITISKEYLRADLKIVLGHVSPDLIFGFTGGRAVLSPGLSSEATYHALYDPQNVDHAGVRYGNFRDNPFHVHGMETAQHAGCDAAVSVLLTPSGHVSRVMAGHFGQSHFQAMLAMREALQASAKEPMDVVVTSGGGAPFDHDMLSLLKSIAAVEGVLQAEGTIVVVGELKGGLGPKDFQRLLRLGRNHDEFIEALGKKEAFIPGQWAAQVLFRILRDHEVIVYTTGIPEEELWALGFTPAKDMNEAILGAMESHGQRCKIVALPDGPFCLGAFPAVPSAAPAKR